MWGAPGVEPSELKASLVSRLSALDELLPRLAQGELETAQHGCTPEVSFRELVQRRSRTALSCRIEARLRRACNTSMEEEDIGPSQPCELFYEKPELLEHALSFLELPRELSGAGQVCTAWYLASRMQTLWEMHLRRSDRLVGPAAEALPLPYEEEWTLFETAARIERHGCRPLDAAVRAQCGTIDSHVDDLAAYQLHAELSEATGQTKPLSERVPGGAYLYLATHATHGSVCIHSLNSQQSRLFIQANKDGRGMPLARSPHILPLLQTIIDESQQAATPSVYLVHPNFHCSLEGLLKREPLDAGDAHSIFCQLAHALQCVHQQGYFHGGVLMNHVVLKKEARGPYALFDRLYACRRVASRTQHAEGRQPHAAAAAAAANAAAAAPAAALLALAAPVAPPPHALLAPLAPPGEAAAEAAETATGGRSFADLLLWAWTAYERLGTLSTGHHDVPEHEVAQAGLLPESYLAADVSDLGRLLLRMLLQPYRHRAAAANATQVGHGHPGGLAEAPPAESAFSPALQRLLLGMLHSCPRERPSMRQVLLSEWVAEPHPGVPRRLCACWKLVSGATDCATPSDLRLLARSEPPLTQANLSHSPAVGDEWLETLASHHAETLRRLDLTECSGVTSSERPLRALARLHSLEVLRLPKERWRETELASCLTQLGALRCIDADTLADLRSEREALRRQCDILNCACTHEGFRGLSPRKLPARA